MCIHHVGVNVCMCVYITHIYVNGVYVFVHHVGVNVCVCECVNVCASCRCECVCVCVCLRQSVNAKFVSMF